MSKFPSFRRAAVAEFSYSGKIVYSADTAEIDRWCGKLIDDYRSLPVDDRQLGFDMEWPMYGRTACVQLFSASLGAFVFQLLSPTVSERLLTLVRDNSVTKVGLNITNDIRKLAKDFRQDLDAVVPDGLCDVGTLARRTFGNSERWSLANLIYNLSGQTLPKPSDIRCGQWDRYPLSADQIRYAALDAFASHWAFVALKNR